MKDSSITALSGSWRKWADESSDYFQNSERKIKGKEGRQESEHTTAVLCALGRALPCGLVSRVLVVCVPL